MRTDHPDALHMLNTLAMILQRQGKFEAAAEILEDLLGRMRVKLKSNHPDTLTCVENLAGVYQDLGKVKEAFPLLEEALRLEQAILGTNHPNTMRTMNNLAVGYWMDKQLEKSIPIFEELVEKASTLFGPKHPNTLMTLMNLGVNLKDSGDLEQALPLLERAYRDGKSVPQLMLMAGPQLLDGYASVENKEATVELSENFLVLVRKQMSDNSLKYSNVQRQVAASLVKAKAFNEAEKLLRMCLDYLEAEQPDSWSTFQAKSMLGSALFGLGKNEAAEPLIVSGYEGMLARLSSIPADGKKYVPQAKQQLVEFFETTHQKDKASKYIE